jgi:hypothetical protein
MHKIILLSGLLLFTFDKASGQNIGSDDYAIYSKVLNAFLKEEKVRGKIVLESDSENEIEVDQHSMWDSAMAKLSYKLDSVNSVKLTFNNFQLKNYQLIIASESELKELFNGNIESGWASFHKKYPDAGGIVRMSRMFLSPGKTWGLIYISISRGGLNGAGYIIKFDLSERKIIRSKERVWTS